MKSMRLWPYLAHSLSETMTIVFCVIKTLNVEAHGTIGIAMRNKTELSLAAQRFLGYIDQR